MPYKSNSELPDSVKNNLPTKAQTIYRKTFNSAHENYDEVTAHKVAWTAVKKRLRVYGWKNNQMSFFLYLT